MLEQYYLQIMYDFSETKDRDVHQIKNHSTRMNSMIFKMLYFYFEFITLWLE